MTPIHPLPFTGTVSTPTLLTPKGGEKLEDRLKTSRFGVGTVSRRPPETTEIRRLPPKGGTRGGTVPIGEDTETPGLGPHHDRRRSQTSSLRSLSPFPTCGPGYLTGTVVTLGNFPGPVTSDPTVVPRYLPCPVFRDVTTPTSPDSLWGPSPWTPVWGRRGVPTSRSRRDSPPT